MYRRETSEKMLDEICGAMCCVCVCVLRDRFTSALHLCAMHSHCLNLYTQPHIAFICICFTFLSHLFASFLFSCPIFFGFSALFCSSHSLSLTSSLIRNHCLCSILSLTLFGSLFAFVFVFSILNSFS